MPIVHVLGGQGMLGVALTYVLRASGFIVHAPGRDVFEIGRTPPETLGLSKGTWVVNAAGVINRRMTSAEGVAEARRVNALFPPALADHCADVGARMIHISTDCVFEGARGPYDERSLANPIDDYGRSKLAGEPSNCLVLRSSILGPELRNHYSLFCWFLSQTGPCRGFRQHLWNGMTSVQMSRCVSEIISRGLYAERVQHLFGEDTTKDAMLRTIADVFDHQVEIVPDDGHARDTRLATCHTDDLAQLPIPPFRRQIEALRPFADPRGHWRTPLTGSGDAAQ